VYRCNTCVQAIVMLSWYSKVPMTADRSLYFQDYKLFQDVNRKKLKLNTSLNLG